MLSQIQLHAHQVTEITSTSSVPNEYCTNDLISIVQMTIFWTVKLHYGKTTSKIKCYQRLIFNFVSHTAYGSIATFWIYYWETHQMHYLHFQKIHQFHFVRVAMLIVFGTAHESSKVFDWNSIVQYRITNIRRAWMLCWPFFLRWPGTVLGKLLTFGL